MPRTNIPYRSTPFFLNKKRTRLSLTHRTGDRCLSENQQASSCPVNNILVFPKNSETTINVLSNNNQSLPYGNLLKKIKARKRKDKQRLKKKQIIEGDIKPVINKVKISKNKKIKPRMNKHIIFLSDSDSENSEVNNQGNVQNISLCDDPICQNDCPKNDEDDDVIFVETPSAEIIEIDDGTEQTETPEKVSKILDKSNDSHSPDVNDFLDNDHINLKSKFNFELHGSEFKGAEFLKPSTVPKDMSESGSVSSISDVSATIGMNVFNVVDFPQEKVNLFDDTNLEKFRNSITPQRSVKKSKNITSFEECNSRSREKLNDNLPTLSDMQIEDNSRKQRGRSIIKELVNERAYVILSAAQKKLKNKKRKSKAGLSDSSEKGTQNDNQESNKKKKKKKCKKRDTSPNETNHEKNMSPSRIDIVDDGNNKNRGESREESEATNYSIAIRTDLFQSTGPEIATISKKSKKSKKSDSEVPINEDDVEKRKKKIKKNDQDGGVSEDNEQKRKKKNKQTSELSVDQQYEETSILQEKSEEKKKKKIKRNLETSTDMLIVNHEIELQSGVAQVPEDDQEKKKKKGRKISDTSFGITPEKNKSGIQCTNIDGHKNGEEKRKKKEHKTSTSSTATDMIYLDSTNLKEAQEESFEITRRNEMEESDLEKKYETDQDIENNKRKKVKKTSEAFTNIDHIDKEHATYTAVSGNTHESGKEKIEIMAKKSNESRTENLGEEEARNEEKNEKFPTNAFANNHGTTDTIIIECDFNKLNNVITSTPHTTILEVLQESEIDLQKNIEQRTNINNKRTSEARENIAKKHKFEELNIEMVDDEINVANRKISEEISEINTNKLEAEKGTIDKNTEEQIVEYVKYTEKIGDISLDNSFDSFKKRKKELSISDNIDDPLNYFEPKRIKIDPETSEPQSDNLIDKEEGQLENIKNLEKDYVEEIANEQHEINTFMESGSIDENVVSVHKSAVVVETPGEPRSVENCNKGVGNNSEFKESVNPSFAINNEGNIDMKITNVFSLNTSIFPGDSSFADDVDVTNFNDKNISSWNAHSSRFHSYNAPLFKDSNRDILSEMSNEVSYTDSVSTPVTKSLLDPKFNQNSALEPIGPRNSTLQTFDEIIVVKTEDQKVDNTVPSENRMDIILQDVEIKKEVQSEDIAKTDVEENMSEQMSSEKEEVTKSTAEVTNTPSEIFHQQLPNEIEEIVKEKDNLDTVKRLCDFLEEATDPNEVLKKVSLLKQAFTDKSQNSVRLQEEVQITYDNDDVFSVSSECSSVVCVEDDVSIVSIEDDITLANCDLTDGAKEITALNEKINNPVARSSDSIEVVSSEVELNETIKNVPSTSQPMLNSTLISSEPHQIKGGLAKYEVEDLQGYMSSDPKLWKIVSEDICPIRIPTKNKRCVLCREMGHLGYNCPNKFNLPKCSLCGMEGHLDFRCPNKLCTQCGRKAPTMRNSCDHCKHFKTLTCTLCKNKGHPKNKCPDLWRRYHLTVKHGPLVQADTLKLKAKKNLWCSICAKSGHAESQCGSTGKKFKNCQPLDPRIYDYEDIYYKVKQTAKKIHSVQPNLDEIPTTTQKFLKNDDSSSTSSSDTPSNALDDVNLDDSRILKDTLENDQPIQNSEGPLEDLSPEFVVIDEIVEDNQDIVLSTSNQNNKNFFMTATIESLKEFVKNELTVLKGSKFNLKNIDHRFYAYREDDKKPLDKARFAVKSKEIFYKELNMLLFGKLEIKRAHKDKLVRFVNSAADSNLTSSREALCYAYDYIFGTKPHIDVNYKTFLRMLRAKYGKQKWLY